MSKRYSIGEVAKLSGVTIRTLQYYDNIGLLPVDKDASGRRYYSSRDVAKLQQVLFYRSLGLPLKEIRELVVEAVTPEQIAAVLMEQRGMFSHKLNYIYAHISAIDAILAGVRAGGTFQSDELLQLITTLNRNAVFEYRNVNYDKDTEEVLMRQYPDDISALSVYWQWKATILECVSLILSGIEPRSEAGKELGQKWLTMIDQITQGRSELLDAHRESYDNRTQWPEEDRRLMELADDFIDAAVAYYFESMDLEEVEEGSD
ncbi:MAG: MerR family transcriptional regulator [Firmicutes bacterium]|nr:MerR family transcriptional regulator [Bacillota bacterium]